MTAKELIEKLSKLEPDTNVFISGSLGGYADIQLSEVEDYTLNANKYIAYGIHAKSTEEEIKSGKSVKGVCLR